MVSDEFKWVEDVRFLKPNELEVGNVYKFDEEPYPNEEIGLFAVLSKQKLKSGNLVYRVRFLEGEIKGMESSYFTNREPLKGAHFEIKGVLTESLNNLKMKRYKIKKEQVEVIVESFVNGKLTQKETKDLT